MQFAGNRRQLAKIGKVVDENPPGTTLCANGRWSTNPPAPGVCSYNGGWIVNYPELSRSLQAKAKKKPSALVLEDAPAADPDQQSLKEEKRKFNKYPFIHQVKIFREMMRDKFPGVSVQMIKQAHSFLAVEVTHPDLQKMAEIGRFLYDNCEYGDRAKQSWLSTSEARGIIIDERMLKYIVFCDALRDYKPETKSKKPSALVLQDAPAADPAPVPVETAEEPEEDITDGPHWRIDPKRKAELHLGYDFYKSLPSETQREIKRFFTWGRGRKAWVSKGRYDSWSVESIIKKLNIPLAGKDERMSFADRMAQQKENAEYRAERMEDRIRKSKKKQEDLQAEFNRLRKDWSWVTQPNVNTSRGRAFTRQREKVYNRYEKGFEEARRREQLYDRMEAALTTAQQWKLKDPDYLQRKIKENQKSVKARTEQLEKLQERLNQPEETYGTVYRDGERRKATKEDVLEAYEWTLEKYQEAAEQLAFFSEALDRLIEEEGIVIYNKENLKGAEYVKRRGDWFKVIRVNPTTVTHTWHAGLWKSPHSEIQDVVYKGDDFEVTPGRFPYKFNIKRPDDKVSGLTPRFRTLRVLNL